MNLISIIIPIYNSELFLERCLSSLKNQTYSNIEFLMIDDGSTDKSAETCKKYQLMDHRFRYIYQPNSGVSAARNRGLNVAAGEYIGFCDSDDWVDADMYETLHRLLSENDADISIVSFKSENGQVSLVNNDDSEVLFFDSKSAILEMHNLGCFEGHLWNKLFKKTLFHNVRFRNDITIYEDMVAVWDLFLNAQKIVFQNVQKYHYYVNPNSAINCAFKESYWSSQIACQEMVKKMTTYFPESLVFAQRTLINGNYSIAHKLFLSRKKVKKQEYLKIKNEIIKHYNATVKKFFSLKQRIKISVFLNSRMLFSVLMYLAMLKNKLAMYLLKK